MICKYLSNLPNPKSIENKYSSILSDPFNIIDQPKIPMNHKYKKSYKIALRDAFFIWNKVKINSLKRELKCDSYTDYNIEQKLYFNIEFFTDYIEKTIIPLKILY